MNWICLGCTGLVYLAIGVNYSTQAISYVNMCEVLPDVYYGKKATYDSYFSKKEKTKYDEIADTCLFGDGNFQSVLPIKD